MKTDIIPTKLLALLIKARTNAEKQRQLVSQIDREMEELGFDIEKIRHEDACGYVDMIDMGIGSIDMRELKDYRKLNQ